MQCDSVPERFAGRQPAGIHAFRPSPLAPAPVPQPLCPILHPCCQPMPPFPLLPPRQGDLHKLQLEGRMPRPDVVVVDPARPGLSPAVISYLRACGCRRLVYVSCNASTQARDIKQLCAATEEGGAAEAAARRGGKERGGGREGGSTGHGSGSSSASGPFRLISMQAVDLYPQTWHVETVAVLDAVQ